MVTASPAAVTMVGVSRAFDSATAMASSIGASRLRPLRSSKLVLLPARKVTSLPTGFRFPSPTGGGVAATQAGDRHG